MLSPHEKRDKIIRATDLDALSCRYSANTKSYFQPGDRFINDLISSYQQFLQFSTGYSNLSAGRTLRSVFNEQKLPLINRGTYLRTKSIDLIINEFIDEFSNGQIISLGGGSDTRCFRVLEQFQDKPVRYVELDFDESVKIKKLTIKNNDKLRKIVNDTDNDTVPEISSKQQFQDFDAHLHTDRYHLIGFDLRNLKANDVSSHGNLLQHIDLTRPSLVLSECVLCYLTPQENEDIIGFWKSAFATTGETAHSLLSYLIYEPMSLNDAFGDTMTQNLLSRGINLHTFDAYPNLEARYAFFANKIGLVNIRVTDMSDVGGYSGSSIPDKEWVDAKELQRINRLELIDEVEEIRLLFKHYCLCYGEAPVSGTGTETSTGEQERFKGVSKWKWLIGPENHP